MRNIFFARKSQVCPQSDVSDGFTLVEILVALFVMLVGLSSAFALFAAATAMHKRATDQSTSAIMADSIFSEIESKLTAGVELSQIIKTNATWPGYDGYSYDVELVPVDANEDEIYVRLTIRYLKQGRERNQYFSTILIRHIPFKGRDYNAPGNN